MKVSFSDSTKLEIKNVQEPLEVVQCDTILGLPNYHLFDNFKSPLTTWLRNSKLGEIHILILSSLVGYDVTVNTVDAVFQLNISQPLIKLIFTTKGYKIIKN